MQKLNTFNMTGLQCLYCNSILRTVEKIHKKKNKRFVLADVKTKRKKKSI